jgi:hypothetical protein
LASNLNISLRKSGIMNKKTLIPVLLVLIIISLGYAVYRSTASRITAIENGQQVVYGDPQHGLLFGLCVFAGLCVLGLVMLILDRGDIRYGQTQGTETTVGSKKIATNYPQ